MSFQDPYVSLLEIKDYLRIPDHNTDRDDRLMDAVKSATSEINKATNRQFNRGFPGTGYGLAVLDDLYVNTTDVSVFQMDGTEEFPAWTAYAGAVLSGAGAPVDGVTNGTTGDLYRNTTAYAVDPSTGWYECVNGSTDTWWPVTATVLTGTDDPVNADGPQTRLYVARTGYRLEVDDFHTTTDFALSTDPSGSGTWAQSWSLSDLQLEPLNGIRDGEAGWPTFRLMSQGSKSFPASGTMARCRVTAHFGWAAIPPNIRQAAFILAAETAKFDEAPFGVAGWSDMGVIRVRDIPKVHKLCYPYERDRVKVGS